jgi:hypothetical protein
MILIKHQLFLMHEGFLMSVCNSIIIFGSGQLGSRYLQGLLKSPRSLRIYLIDRNPNSLAVARDRASEIDGESIRNKIITYHLSICDCPNIVDVTIVSTTSHDRVKLVAALKDHVWSKYWLLEKVLVQSPHDLKNLLSLMVSDQNVWVNTPRRIIPWHIKIREHLIKKSPLNLKVSGVAWGLACNSIHFLDMFAWLSGESLLQISTDELENEWFEAKRPGNWEVIGTIKAIFSAGSTATLSVQVGELTDLSYQFDLEDGEFTWHIDEEKGLALRSDGLSIPGRLPFQSEVTPHLVNQILSTGKCELPTLSVSAEIHHVFLDAMLKHWRKTVDVTATSVPIT